MAVSEIGSSGDVAADVVARLAGLEMVSRAEGRVAEAEDLAWCRGEVITLRTRLRHMREVLALGMAGGGSGRGAGGRTQRMTRWDGAGEPPGTGSGLE